jgi:ectoine hydroxylase-related dioxygenase (phytanoyl-CoA dioxygenase family)
MDGMKTMIQVSEEQIQFFRNNGYLAIESITTPEELEMMRDAYDRIFAQRAGRESGDQFDLAGTDEEGTEAALPQILNPPKYAPELRDTIYRKNALAISQQLLGPETVPMGDHAIFKPARFGAATPWHQDEAYWNPELEYTTLSVWMPLQEATIENGCMQFIPGSHKLEVLPHHSIHHDPRIHGLEVDEGCANLSNPAICPLPAGGATFHLNRTLHYTGPNRSDIPRRAYILGFGLPPQPRATPRRFPWNEQKIAPRQERAKAAANTEEPMVNQKL